MLIHLSNTIQAAAMVMNRWTTPSSFIKVILCINRCCVGFSNIYVNADWVEFGFLKKILENGIKLIDA
jgi:hypothetical protein